MPKLAAAACCLTVVVALGCGSKPSTPTPGAAATPGATATPKLKDLIVGKWEAVEPMEAAKGALTFQFKADGTVVKSMNSTAAPFPLIASGKYTFPADDTIQIEFEPAPPFLKEKPSRPNRREPRWQLPTTS